MKLVNFSKSLLCIAFLLCAIAPVKAQFNAMNFTAKDCDGTTHTLYTDIGTDKIAVLIWVMPCEHCVGAPLSMRKIFDNRGAASSKILYYLIDDFGDILCSDLSDWCKSINLDVKDIYRFDNAGVVIPQDSFGGVGMPHVAIINPSHQVIYNGFYVGDSDSDAYKQAIDFAFLPSSVASVRHAGQGISIYPTPAADLVNFEFDVKKQGNLSYDIINAQGQLVEHISKSVKAGTVKETVDVHQLPNGIYSVQLNVDGATQMQKFLVAR